MQKYAFESKYATKIECNIVLKLLSRVNNGSISIFCYPKKHDCVKISALVTIRSGQKKKKRFRLIFGFSLILSRIRKLFVKEKYEGIRKTHNSAFWSNLFDFGSALKNLFQSNSIRQYVIYIWICSYIRIIVFQSLFLN